VEFRRYRRGHRNLPGSRGADRPGGGHALRRRAADAGPGPGRPGQAQARAARRDSGLDSGMEQHALPLKTMGDAMEIRNRVLRRVARSSSRPTRRSAWPWLVPGNRRRLLGVEVAGELADCIRSLKRYYPAVRPRSWRSRSFRTSMACCPSCRRARPVRAAFAARSRRARAAQGAGHADRRRWRLGQNDEADRASLVTGENGDLYDRHARQPADRRLRTVHRARSHQDGQAISASKGRSRVGAWRLRPGHQSTGPKALAPTAQFAVRQARICARNLLCHSRHAR